MLPANITLLEMILSFLLGAVLFLCFVVGMNQKFWSWSFVGSIVALSMPGDLRADCQNGVLTLPALVWGNVYSVNMSGSQVVTLRMGLAIEDVAENPSYYSGVRLWVEIFEVEGNPSSGGSVFARYKGGSMVFASSFSLGLMSALSPGLYSDIFPQIRLAETYAFTLLDSSNGFSYGFGEVLLYPQGSWDCFDDEPGVPSGVQFWHLVVALFTVGGLRLMTGGRLRNEK